MKADFLKLLLLVTVSLTPPLASAQIKMQYSAANPEAAAPPAPVVSPASPDTTNPAATSTNGDSTETIAPPVSAPAPVESAPATPPIAETHLPTPPPVEEPILAPIPENEPPLTPPVAEPTLAPKAAYQPAAPAPAPTPTPQPAPKPSYVAAAVAAPAPNTTVAAVAQSSPVNIGTPATATESSTGLNSKMTWRIQTGERISDVFARWAHQAGWQMTWEPDDLIAQADLELNDTLTGAVTKMIDALNRGGANIQAKFYTANHMLRVMARK